MRVGQQQRPPQEYGSAPLAGDQLADAGLRVRRMGAPLLDAMAYFCNEPALMQPTYGIGAAVRDYLEPLRVERG